MPTRSAAPRLPRLCAMVLAMALVLVLLLPHSVAAPVLSQPADRPRDPVQWAVELGLLDGGATTDFESQRPITRAELAAMLTRLFDATQEAPLDAFTDVGRGAWYDSVMAKAVAMGMFRGDSQGRLQPAALLTRQDAAVLLGRVLGIAGGDPAVLQPYQDASAAKDYAAPYLAAMVESGYLRGTSDTALSPAAVLTRGQAVQLLYQSVHGVCTDQASVGGYADGLVILRGASAAGLRHAGDVLLDVGSSDALDLRDISVTGRLVVRSAAPLLTVRVGEDVKAAQLVFCTPAEVSLRSDALDTVSLLADGSAIDGDGQRLYVEGSSDCKGDWRQIDVRADHVRLRGGPMDQLNIYAGSTMDLQTRAAHADVYAPGYVLGGDGYVDEAWLHGPDMQLRCTVNQSICDYDAGLRGVQLTAKQAVTVHASKPEASISFTVSGVDSRYVYGVPGGVRSCSATLYRGAAALHTVSDFQLRNGATLTFPVRFTFQRYMPSATDELRVVVRYREQEISARQTVQLQNYPDEHYAKLSGGKNPYYIEIVKNHNVVIVYGQDSAGQYTVPVKTFLCSTGKYTPLGSFTTSTKKRWGTLFANYEHTRYCYGQYVTTIHRDYLFHSVPYFTPSPDDLEYEEFNKLGQTASMGCIRLTVADVKWIYDNCPAGTGVKILNYETLPVDRPTAPRIDPASANRGWDPTDPDPANPWKKAK